MARFHLRQLLSPWPVQWAVLALVVGSMLTITAILASVGWVASKQSLLETAARTARSTGVQASERSFRLIDPGKSTLRVLAFDPVTSATTEAQRLQRVPVFASELSANPLVSAIYAAYDNGDFLLVRSLDTAPARTRFHAPDAAAFLVATITLDSEGIRRTVFRFLDAALGVVEVRQDADFHLDPRTRPWYAAARNTADTRISYPYVFTAPHQVGFTLSRRSSNGQAILGLDITLEALARSLNELRPTSESEMVLVNREGKVMTYFDMSRVVLSQHGAGEDTIQFQTIQGLGIDALHALHATRAIDTPVSYTSGGREWLGLTLPFHAIEGANLWLLIASPTDALLGDLIQERDRLMWVALLVIALVLPLGWWGGRAIGRSLQSMAQQAARMSHFDFHRPERQPSMLREVQTLTDVINDVSITVESFLSISQVLGSETRIETLLQQVLEKLVAATRSQGGAVYQLEPDSAVMRKVCAVGEQVSLHTHFSDVTQRPAFRAPQPAGTGASQIAFAINGRDGALRGMLLLVYGDDAEHRSPEFWDFTNQLTGMLAVAWETRQLIEAQKQLFDAIIHVLADAIDAKSPYTGGHCERVPQLAIMLAESMASASSGPYANFHFSEEERYAFHLAAWLHDCGKVTSQEHIVDKATKLEVIYNRIHEIRTRFEVLWRDAEIAYLHALRDGANAQHAAQQRTARQQQLQDDFQFVASCNIGGEFLADDAIARLQRIGKTAWLRHFDDTQGLSSEERQRLAAARAPAPTLPAPALLLADLPEHAVPWGDHKPAVERGDPGNTLGFDMALPALQQNLGELHNLCVRRGTLTEEDRFNINNHIVQTLIMLHQLPWPQQLARVPDMAANHHEKMDGTGYPRRLPAHALALPDRIMAIADIFEALTAHDRPYKAPKTVSQSLRIMATMAKDRHIDAQLFLYFLRSRTWETYAQRFMQPAQMDAVDIEALAALVPAELLPPA